MVVAYASGTQTAIVGTEFFLSSPNVTGTFTFHVDTINMQAGDTLELRVYQMILSGGTSRVAYYTSISNAPSPNNVIEISVPVSNDLVDTNALRFSLKQTVGVARGFPWKVLKYG